MAAESDFDAATAAIDAQLAAWRQGDCSIGEHWFAYRVGQAHPITDAGRVALEGGADLAEQLVPGFVVVTQTCDIIRSCIDRPFVEVCPLVEVEEVRLREVQRCRRPAYAFVPSLSERRLVADLNRVMTLEKPVVAGWKRTPGCTTDAQARAFALALSRKRVRFAFPDDFVAFASKLQKRLDDKHEKNTGEGRALRALREIRVLASPSWDAVGVELFFWFIREDGDDEIEGRSWADSLKAWLSLVPGTGRFTSVEGQVVTLQDMTAADHIASDQLDLDNLSSGRE